MRIDLYHSTEGKDLKEGNDALRCSVFDKELTMGVMDSQINQLSGYQK